MFRFTAAFVVSFVPALATAGVLMSQEKALSLAFPDGKFERSTLTLTETEKKEVEKAARARVPSPAITYYSGALSDGNPGRAFFETHVVRTMPETFMAVVDSSGAVRFVELLSFYEPGDYLPPRRWLDQFRGRPLDDDLLVKRRIRNVTGATLTTQALTDGVRRALAVSAAIDRRKLTRGNGK